MLNSFNSSYVFCFPWITELAAYSSRRMTIDFKSVSMHECCRDWKHSQHPSNLVSGIFNFIFNMKSKSGSVAPSLCLDLWLVLYRWCLNHHMICRLLQILFSVLFHNAEVQTCWHWTSYFHLLICTAYVNHFIASVCPLHLLFLEGFE